MPEEWTDREERQYDHIKKSEMQRGKSEDRAEEIAASTVNKQRRKSGKTENKTTRGTGNPNRKLEDRTVEQLRNRARELNIDGRSKMDKEELVKAIRDRQ